MGETPFFKEYFDLIAEKMIAIDPSSLDQIAAVIRDPRQQGERSLSWVTPEAQP
jgi:hypothetical protein